MNAYLALLLVPVPALGAFLLLGLGPAHLERRAVQAVALAGGILPALVMLPLVGLCLSGSCNGLVPIFTLTVGPAEVALALALDPLSALVGGTVTVIGAAVMAYSIDYMAGKPVADLRRYFALMNLFLAAMLSMVLAGDSIVLFFGWELMGLCSFFLIAYHVTNPRAIAAGRKAFVITRVADALLLAGLLLLFLEAGSVRFEALMPAGIAAEPERRMLIAALLLGGALGKSAQLPMHTWLPTAMAGPTPVSALLHSATMVAAGAFLLARFAPMLAAAPLVLAATAVFGAATAFYGALSAVFQKDIKRLLAYSSISQIGFMMLAIGVGAPEAAIAHFVVHAAFKALLFLAAGDITHINRGSTDISAMRGALWSRPLAYLCFVAGAASLAGLPMVTAGWFSKEAVLAAAWLSGPFGMALWAVALLAAVMTGIYAFRPVFTGLIRFGAKSPSFASAFTNVPLVLLALAALGLGWAVDPIVRFLGGVPPHAPLVPELAGGAAPLLGAGLAAALTFVPGLSARVSRARRIRGGFRFDGLYHAVVVRPFAETVRWLVGARGGPADPVGHLPVAAAQRIGALMTDPRMPDPLDRGWAGLGLGLLGGAERARRLQTGRLRDYALALAVGLAALALLAWGTAWR